MAGDAVAVRGGVAVSSRRIAMRRRRVLSGLLMGAMAAFTATACARTNQGEAAGTLAPANVVGLRVQNNNFLDVDVYAVSQGVPTRMGTVTGNSTKSFVVDGSLVTQDFRVLAIPIGGSGQASTGAIIVSPGQTIEFTVGSILRNSTVSIR
jgi:hypothetical protein